MLHRRRIEFSADLREKRLARNAISVEHADLHELVREQIDVDLVEHRGGEPVGTDRDNRLQVMRFRAQRSSRRRC